MKFEMHKPEDPNDQLSFEFGPAKIKLFATGEPATILYVMSIAVSAFTVAGLVTLAILGLR